MNLRSGPGCWAATDPPPPVRGALARDERCGVVVIGAGITGALIAHALTLGGHECVVLDRRAAAMGSTAASTAIVQYELDTPLTELARRLGWRAAAEAYRLCARAVRDLVRLSRRVPGAGVVSRRPSYYLASEPEDAERLRLEARARRRAGLRVRYLTQREVERRFPFSRPAAIRSACAAECDPVRLTRALLSDSEAHGARVYEHTPVSLIESFEGGVLVRTERGPVVRAGRAVIATGYEAVPGIRRWAPARLVSTYAIATQALAGFPGWPRRCVLWETARPYLYARTAGDRAIVGGEDEPITDAGARDALVPAKAARLAERINELFPGLSARADLAWAGTFGQSDDGLAYIDQTPEVPGVLLAVGLGGNGMTFGVIAARLAAAWCAGRAPPELELFALDRPGAGGHPGAGAPPQGALKSASRERSAHAGGPAPRLC